VTFSIKRIVKLDEISMMIRDFSSESNMDLIFREVVIDLREFEGLIFNESHPRFKGKDCSVISWKDRINIVRW
jgi:hypothetical protein